VRSFTDLVEVRQLWRPWHRWQDHRGTECESVDWSQVARGGSDGGFCETSGSLKTWVKLFLSLTKHYIM